MEEDYEFHTLPFSLTIETDSQPFVGDLNGDFLDDIMYTEASTSSQILVAFQLSTNSALDPPVFFTTNFENALIVRNPKPIDQSESADSPDSACI